jgi:hypothetical protein
VIVNTPAQPLPVQGTLTGSVTVTNTPSVTVANTPSVTVANTPSVNARQSGAWSVSLSGPAEVQGTVNAAQAGAWAVGIDPLANTVRLDAQEPIAVRDVDAGALEPFQADLQDDAPVIVPAGRRLVIEFVSLTAFGREDTGFLQAFVTTTAGGRTARHVIATTMHPFTVDGETTNRYYHATHRALLYADPGTEVRYGAAQSGATNATTVSISGRLFPLP